MKERKWAIDCHETLTDVWTTLDYLKSRMADNKRCPEKFVTEIYNVQEMINKIAWNDEVLNTAEIEMGELE